MQSEFRHTTHHDFRERAKLEGRHSEADEEHLSQPSTMHSLGNLEEHSSPVRDTPKSSKVYQYRHQIKHEVLSQTGSIKNMLKRVFGEKVDPARDNDQNTKQVMKKVNQDILQLPKRNERVIESVGQGSGKEISSHHFSGHTFEKISEIRDRVAHYMPQVREGAHLFVSVARNHLGEIKDNFLSSFNWPDSVSPSTDLSPSIKEQLNRVNQDIRQLPRKRYEQVIESTGQAQNAQFKEAQSQSQPKESSNYQSSQIQGQSQGKKPDEKELWDMAFHKIEEMKEKAHQKGQDFKHEAEKVAQKSFGKNEESGQQKPQREAEHQDFHHLHHEHHHLSAQSRSFQSTERGRELVQTVKEGHVDQIDHSAHLTAQSRSFQSTEHGRELAQTVKEADSSVPLTKKVEEVESHWKQEEGQGGSLKEGAQELKSKISEKVGEIKQSLQSGEQQREPLLDKIANRIRAMSDDLNHTIRESFKVEERPHDHEPLLDKVMGEINRRSGNVRQRNPSSEGSEEKDIASMLIRNLERKGIQLENLDEKDIASMLSRNLKLGRKSGQTGEQFEEITFTLYEDHSIKERIQDKVHKLSDKIRRRKSEGSIEEITFTLYEDHSVKEKIQEGIHHLAQNVKGKLSSAKKAPSQGKEEHEIEFKQKLSNLRAQAQNLQNLISQKQSEDIPEGYHQVATGFSETVKHHLHETRYIGPMKSLNPFEALGADIDEADEPENLTEVLPDQPPFDLSISQSIFAIPHRIKESLVHGIDEIKNKLVGKHHKSFDEKHTLVPMEVQGEEEEYEEEPYFEDEHPSKGKIRQRLEGFSSKISHNIEAVKGKLKSKKEDLPEAQKKKEILKNKIFEVKPKEILNQGLSTKPNVVIGLQQAKHKNKKSKTPKSASKAYPKENVALKEKGPSFEEFHNIASGFSKSVAEFKKELRGPPLVSSNPFNGLIAGTLPKRKVSFQEPQQQKKKSFRLSQSAGKEAKKKRYEDFHRITTGFSESVEHYQREIRGDPLISGNPFEPLGTRKANLIQSLEHTKKSAKKAKKVPGADITNKVGESQVKALIQKTKGEIHDASNKISGKLHQAKDKIKSMFHAVDKENIAQTA